MRTVPTTDARYWATILVACTMGETAGDFVSHGLNLGYGMGSVALVSLFAFVMILELRAKVPNEARYWTAIVITSTTGTTLADFVTRSMKLGYGWGTAFLVGILGVMFLVWKRRAPAPPGGAVATALPHVEIATPAPGSVLPHVAIEGAKKRGPSTDARYWAAILVVSTLGTTLGDFVSDGLSVGTGRGTLLLGGLLAVVLILELRAKVANEPRYWTAIVLTSTIGATSGDYLTKDDGLNLGFGVGSAIMMAAFVVVVLVGRLRARPAVA
jgi:uncharacterized membrane-anchored protein